MKILVTGLSGLVGSRFRNLYSNVYDFVNIDLTNGVDITNALQVMQLINDHADAKAIIHLAAFTNVSAANEQQGDKEGSCFQVNVLGTHNIVDAARKHQIYLIHISTDYVFDGKKSEPYLETDKPHPIEWYGQTKYEAEKVVESYDKSVILRLAFPYQALPSRPDFLAKIIQNLKQDNLPPAFTDHTITPTFVDDVSRVLDFCVRNQPTSLYHMVGSSSHTDYEIATLVKKIFNLPGNVQSGMLQEYLNTIKRPYQETMKISNEKLTSDFGISMTTFEQGLEVIRSQR